ncbi:daughter of sevenless isoform X2 [Rhynchophorus ferrugineus]|uniref:daughter of sevenless isoform X2 n=1 Tax=Rhynchophorus ferrugineus TaxID=354439 RepID=UPI003FCE8043
MAKPSEEVVLEGWLTKSPPTKRIWRAKWRRRWFLLTHSGDIPGQYVLTYYGDRNRRKFKGVIDLDNCDQVDLGLKLEDRNLTFDHVFDIKTPNRIYYLAADTEEEMKSWVKCICRVCGLKSTNEEEDVSVALNSPDIEITEEAPEPKRYETGETPPVSPTTSPYIPISECITGKSPVYDTRDFKALLEYNRRNSNRYSSRTNDCYEYHQPQNNYINYTNDPERNYVNDLDPKCYDSPRQLIPPKSRPVEEHSPLRSPTDSDSVFNEDEYIHFVPNKDTLKKTRQSDSSADLEPTPTEKFTKVVDNKLTVPPPRPPKPAHITPPPCYLNLTPTPTKISKDSDDKSDKRLVGQVFRYDSEATQNIEPSSPAHSQCSSTPAYSNLPSPVVVDVPLKPPPFVNRELKPKRKLSDAHSTCSINEPPSPRNAGPSVDRKLKPLTPLQDANMRKSFQMIDEDGTRKIRAAPSPTPPGACAEDLYQNQGEVYHFISSQMQYLDLDLEGSSSSSSTTTKSLPRPDTVYKKVDFAKTEAFNLTRNNLEKQRKEPVTTFVKK